ncbi:MAG: HEPN domain-containing protein [Nitrospinae bacterium]|nr:HEPN domain-containing protein [Nitrospinota bacterium]
MDKIEKGLLYLEQANKALIRDFEAAFLDGDWNIAVRRAQESIEHSVKAIYLFCGKDPPKSHFPGLRKLLSRVLPVVFGRKEDLLIRRGPYLVRRDKLTGALRYILEEKGVYTELAAGYTEVPPAPFGLRIKDNAIKIFYGDEEIVSSTTISEVDLSLHRDELKQIAKIVKKLALRRAPAFYFDVLFSQADAEEAREEAWTVFRRILQIVGVQVSE